MKYVLPKSLKPAAVLLFAFTRRGYTTIDHKKSERPKPDGAGPSSESTESIRPVLVCLRANLSHQAPAQMPSSSTTALRAYKQAFGRFFMIAISRPCRGRWLNVAWPFPPSSPGP